MPGTFENLPRGVLFDLDGTLFDTAPDFLVAFNALREEHSYAPIALEDMRPLCSYGALTMISRALDIAIESIDETLRQHFLRLYATENGRQAQLFDGIETLLELLEGIDMPWGIATNKPEFLTLPLLAESLAYNPRCIVCPDHVTTPKPAPDALLLAAVQLEVAPEDCIYIGDSVRDSEAATAAGMPFVAAAWGYLDPSEDVREWDTCAIATVPEEIVELLEQPLH